MEKPFVWFWDEEDEAQQDQSTRWIKESARWGEFRFEKAKPSSSVAAQVAGNTGSVENVMLNKSIKLNKISCA